MHTLATRNLIDADDVKNITLKFINENSFNKIINVAYLENFSTIQILEILEKHFNKTAKTSLVKSGQSYLISIPEAEAYFTENKLTEKKEYLLRIIKRYY